MSKNVVSISDSLLISIGFLNKKFYVFLLHEYNHKIPFQLMLYFNQQPNLTTIFNFVTSSLLLTGHVRFPIPLGFQSQVKPQDVYLAGASGNTSTVFCKVSA